MTTTFKHNPNKNKIKLKYYHNQKINCILNQVSAWTSVSILANASNSILLHTQWLS